MKLIAIASEDDKGLQAEVSAHFGRCPYYTLVQVEGERVIKHQVAENPNWGQHQPGAMPRFIRSLGANVILSGGMGPRAIAMFQSFGIEVATGVSGTVEQVLAGYLQGRVAGIVPCEHDHPESCGGHHTGQPYQLDRASDSKPRRVAIPAQQDAGLSAAMDPRFGRAPYFVLVDLESGEALQTISNTAASEVQGAGISAARIVAEAGANAVVAGRFGPKAIQALQALGIELWTVGEELTVGQAVETMRAGRLVREQGSP